MKKIYVILLMLALGTQLKAQQNKVIINSTLSGIVLDEKTKEPIPGASIQIKGTTHGVLTDASGKFYFQTGQKFPYTLVVSFIGYQKIEYIANGTPVTIALKESVKELNEVVVVGYGTQNRKDITGSVASVSKESLNQVSSSADNLLRGAVAGVVVTQSSGQPGASSSIRIRGGNSITGGNEPLYVIDGVLVYNDNANSSAGNALAGAGLNVLSTINPSDIESIEVLKDASATAIYGSRGANGVVIINTKKGTRGVNNVSYSFYYGTQQVTKKLSLLNGQKWAKLRNDIQTGIGQTPSFTASQIEALGNGFDWQSAAFREAPIQNHQISFIGGDERSRYNVSGGYFGQDGVIIGSDFKRYSARVNYEKNISNVFKFGLTSTTSSSHLNGISANNSSANLGAPNTLAGVLLQSPAVPIYNADGSYNVTTNPYVASVNGYIQNPIADLASTVNQTKVVRVLSSLFGEYNLSNDLTAKVTLNGDLISTKQNYYAPSFTTNGAANKGVASVGNRNVTTWLNENTLTYNKAINQNHQISALVGYTVQQTEGEIATANSYGFVNDINKYNALQDGTAGKPFSDAYKSVLKSWLGRVNYSLLQRYHFTFSARADGSSRFGSASRWGFFPSAGFSWNITDEDFAKDISGISSLKLRLSTGATGNQEIADYLSLASLGSTNYTLGGTNLTGFSPTRLSNPDLKWEKTTQSNIGLDVSLFDKRVSLVFDAYYKKTTDLLVNVPVPLSSGYGSVLQNIGAVENKGIEFALTTENIRGEDFNWKTTGNIAFNRNQVLEIGNGVQQFFPTVPSGVLSLQQPVIVKVGYPLGTFWGYQTDGVFQSSSEIASQATLNGVAATKPGDRRYKDISGPNGVPDGKISAAYDKVNLGSAQPLFTADLSNTLTYRGFDLTFSFQGVYGNKIFNALRQQLEIPNLANNVSAELANYWTPTNTNTDVPRAANSPAAVVSDRTVEDGSFVRLKTLTLGYTLPKTFSEKFKLSNVKVYVSGTNLLTWTKYSGFDPEISSYEQSNLYPGIDYGAYPNARTITAGLNVSF